MTANRGGAGRPGTAVVAVGGNALTAQGQTGTPDEIAGNAARAARGVAQLFSAGWRLAVVHGNGPQVGNLAIQQAAAEDDVPPQPLHDLCAMTQGQLGSVLVRAVDALVGRGTAVALVTHVLVDLADPAFAHPTKPIGPFLPRERALELARSSGFDVAAEAGRGWRRVVASPLPVRVVELDAVRTLLAAGHVVLAGGGGGVAVTDGHDGGLLGVDAVIDKDLTAALLATSLGASELYLLTDVDAVMLDFATPHQRPVHTMSVSEAQQHLADGHFAAGSMGPKVTAALAFLRDGGERVVVTSSARLAEAVAGEAGAGTSIQPAAADVAS